MNLREQFEKETGIHETDSIGMYPTGYVTWLEQRNKEQVEVLKSNASILEAIHFFLKANKNYNRIDVSGIDNIINQTQNQLKKAGAL